MKFNELKSTIIKRLQGYKKVFITYGILFLIFYIGISMYTLFTFLDFFGMISDCFKRTDTTSREMDKDIKNMQSEIDKLKEKLKKEKDSEDLSKINYYKILEIEDNINKTDPYKRMNLLLKEGYEKSDYEKDLMSPPIDIVRPYILRALSYDNPDYVLSEFVKIMQSKNDNLKVLTAGQLAETLNKDYKQKFIEACKNNNNKEVCLEAAKVLSINTNTDLETALSLLDMKNDESNLIKLIYAIEKKENGCDPSSLLNRITIQTEDLPTTHPINFINDYLNNDISKIIAIIDKLDFQKDGNYFIEPLNLLMKRMPEGQQAAYKIINNIFQESNKLGNLQRLKLYGIFSMLNEEGFAGNYKISSQGEWALDYISGYLKNANDKDVINNSFYIYWIAKGLINEDNDKGIAIAEILANRILSFKNFENYSHMIGTLSGAIAIKDSEKAIELSKKITSLEWGVNAQRCIYRAWGRYDPIAAKNKIYKDWVGDAFVDKKIRSELLVEVFLSESLNDPINALKNLNSLEDSQNRFNYGTCLLAPELSKIDFAQALRLVAPNDLREINTNSALSMAIMLLKYHEKPFYFLDRKCDFYPDCYAPMDQWPGPFLSKPLGM